MTAEEFLRNEYEYGVDYEIASLSIEGHHAVWCMQEFAKLKVKEAIEAISEKVELTEFAQEFLQEGASDAIDKESIVTAYPLTNII
jgi:hypothetical protein